MALDGDPQVGGGGGISQTINGLIDGAGCMVSFTWAGAELQSRSGATTEKIQVSLGSNSIITNTVPNARQGFTGWMTQSYYFLATSASATLSFLAIGTPTGLPPVVVLTDVGMTSVPKPATMAIFGTGLLGLMASRRCTARETMIRR